MPKLIVKKNETALAEYALPEARKVCLVGSGIDCDLRIEDQSLPDHLLRVDRLDGCYYLEAMDDKTVLHMNGKALSGREQIVDGDELSFAPYEFLFENQSPLQAPHSELESEEIRRIEHEFAQNAVTSEPAFPPEQKRPGGGTQAVEVLESARVAGVAESEGPHFAEAGEVPLPFSLVAVYGPYLGKRYPLKNGDTRIGRDTTLNDIVIRKNEHGSLDPSISRRHATVSYRDGHFFVSDKRSKTRTYVNQLKLAPEDEQILDEGDEIEVVSDQNSTIFRLVGNHDHACTPPKKAGTWWVRHAHHAGLLLSVLFALGSATAVGFSCSQRQTLNSAPAQLKFFEETWYQGPATQLADVTGAEPGPRQSTVAAADLTGDSAVDIVFADADGGLHVLDGVDKNPIWENEHIRVQNEISIVLADMNQNGLQDVLVLGSDSRLRGLDGKTGAEMWLSPLLGDRISGAPVVDDFDGDGLKDVLVASAGGRISVGYGDVSALKWKQVDTHVSIESTPASADLDGDGRSEIFLGTSEGKLLLIDGATAQVSRIYDPAPEFEAAAAGHGPAQSLRAPTVIFDVNGDDKPDLLLATSRGENVAVAGSDLAPIWHEKLHVESDASSGPAGAAAGKIDNDERLDAVLASDVALRVIRGGAAPEDAKSRIVWEYYADPEDPFVSPLTLVDLNKDGSDEVIVAGRSGSIFVFNGADGKLISEIHNENNPVVSPILVADVAGNGQIDLVFTRTDGNVHLVQTNSPTLKDEVLWGQAYGTANQRAVRPQINAKTAGSDFAGVAFGLLFLLTAGATFHSQRSRRNKIEENQSDEDVYPQPPEG